MIVLTNQFRANPETLATGIAGFYEREYGLIAGMRVERDHDPGRTEKLFRFLTAASEGRIETRAVAERSHGMHPIERLQGGLKGLTRVDLHRVPEHGGTPQILYDETAVCFYKADGTPLPYWAIGFTRSGQIAYSCQSCRAPLARPHSLFVSQVSDEQDQPDY